MRKRKIAFLHAIEEKRARQQAAAGAGRGERRRRDAASTAVAGQ
jgi:hypothetical protein